MSKYYTILKPTEGLYKEKGSKFLAFAFPIASEEDVKERLLELKKTYYDARHHCYAWVLGMENQRYRANDDGEPAHSAGDPILGQLKSFELTNTLVIVVRYFGGTKLGVGGLINAYKTATEEALRQAGKAEIFEVVNLHMQFPYDLLSTVERLIGDFQMSVITRDFQEDCKVDVTIKKKKVDNFKASIVDLYNLKWSTNDN